MACALVSEIREGAEMSPPVAPPNFKFACNARVLSLSVSRSRGAPCVELRSHLILGMFLRRCFRTMPRSLASCRLAART